MITKKTSLTLLLQIQILKKIVYIAIVYIKTLIINKKT